MIYLDNAAVTKPINWNKQMLYKCLDKHKCDYLTKTPPDIIGQMIWFNSNTNYANVSKNVLKAAREIIMDDLDISGGVIIFCNNATHACDTFVRLCKKNNLISEIYADPTNHQSSYVQNRCGENDAPYKMHILEKVNHLTGCYCADIEKDQQTIVANDLTAAVGKVALPLLDIEHKYDAVWFSGQKFHAPEVGILWIGDRVWKQIKHNQTPENNYGVLYGTIDAIKCLKLAVIFDNICEDTTSDMSYINILSQQLFASLSICKIPYQVLGDTHNKTNAIVALRIPNVLAEGLQLWLAKNNIYVGIGASACESHNNYTYRVASQYIDKHWANQVIRVSFGTDVLKKDIKKFCDKIKEYMDEFVRR